MIKVLAAKFNIWIIDESVSIELFFLKTVGSTLLLVHMSVNFLHIACYRD